MSNLLKDASILLTPTAYDNGRMLSIKPSKDLYGPELVTNGDFSNGLTSWTTYGVTSVSSGIVTIGASSNSGIFQGILTQGKKYKATINVTSYNGVGNAQVTNDNGSVLYTITTTGLQTFYFEHGVSNANIIVRATASSVLSISSFSVVEDLSGDFTFSRNSAATRVNAQGLVENVQILSSNLVQNGSFSQIGAEEVTNGSFSEQGSELITNGDFATDSNWTKSGQVTISEGVAYFDSDGTFTQIAQTLSGISGKNAKVVVEITEYNQGTLKVLFSGGTQQNLPTSVGVHTLYFSNVSSNTINIARVGGVTNIKIDNVSVKEVGQDWTLGTGWSIADGKASNDGSVSGNDYLINSPSTVVIGKTYKVEFTLSNYTQGNIRVKAGNASSVFVASNGNYIQYMVATNTETCRIQARNNFIGSIYNVSVKEVGQDWILSGESEIVGNSLRIYSSDGSASYANQTNMLSIGKNYKVSFNVVSLSGSIYVAPFNPLDSTNRVGINTVGYQEVYFTNALSTGFIISRSGACDATIDNISVIEITDDTNLPRINYEGFSYQDSLGSELVTGGNFSNPSDWALAGGSPPTIVNNKLNLIGNTYNSIASNVGASLVSGKTYKVSFEITDYTSGGATFRLGGVFGVSKSGLGVHTQYIVSDGTSIRLYSSANGTDLSIDNVSVKEVLGQEVVPDSGCGSWLLEDESTNLVPYSSDFSSLNIRDNAVVTSNQIISPSGLLDADEITFDGTLYGRVEASFSVTNGATYTISVYLKNKDLSDVTQVWFGFDQIGLGQFITITDEWQRYEITLAANGTTEYPRIQFSGSGSLYAWGFQTEQQSYATSYIPTSGATSTRLRDLATDSGNATLINSTEGVLYFEGSFSKNTSNQQLTLNNGTTSERIVLEVRNNGQLLRFNVRSSDTNSVEIDQSINTDTYYKLGLLWSGSIAKFYLNGSLIGSDSSVTYPIGLDSMSFNSGTNSFPFYGKTKALAVYKEALTDANLRCLTYPPAVATTFDLNFNTIATDFTFTRGSEATFVNAQGLIQSTNEIGAEEITNGDFSNGSTGWNFTNVAGSNGWSISNGRAICDNTNPLNGRNLNSTTSLVNGKSYKLVLDILQSEDNISIIIGSTTISNAFPIGTTLGATYIIDSSQHSGGAFSLYAGTSDLQEIDNVSVKEYITATNTPRLDYSTGVEAFLLEPQGTNLIPYSEDFSNPSWGNVNSTDTSNYGISPDGLNNSTRFLTTGNTGSFLYINQLPISNATNYTLSFWVKSNGNSLDKFRLYTTTGGTSLEFTSNNKWVRYEYNFLSTGTTTNLGLRGVVSQETDVQIWGAQLEQQTYATSYIPTSGASATRNQELCNNATPVINSEEGTLYAEISALTNGGSTRALSLSNGTGNVIVMIRYRSDTNQIQYLIKDGINADVGNAYTLTDATQYSKVALKYKSNDISFWVDGIEVSSPTSTISLLGLNDLSFDGSGTQNFFGNTKGLKYYPKALADVQLEDLTTI